MQGQKTELEAEATGRIFWAEGGPAQATTTALPDLEVKVVLAQ